jgi:hypothetical protein
MVDEELVQARASAITSAPIGCAFLRRAVGAGLTAAEVADPLMTMHLLADAVCDVSIWRSDYEPTVEHLLTAGPGMRSLAQAVLAHPGTNWWFGPMPRDRQLWHVGGIQTDFLAARNPFVPEREPTDWERYAQKPAWGIQTSTDAAKSGLSANQEGASGSAGDLGPVEYPLERFRLLISPSARIYSVNGPGSWRRLCLAYPGTYGGQRGPDAAVSARLRGYYGDQAWYTPGQVIPDFAAIARDWDGVHITLGGLLTGSHVRVDGPEGWTWLWGYDAEMTIWLRWAFDKVERLPDLTEPISTPSQFR